MKKQIPFFLIIGIILILGGIFTYITFKDLKDKKEHYIKIMVNRGEAIIDAFEAASREISSGDYRKKFWIQKLLVETSRVGWVKYIFISSPDGIILARSNQVNTDYKELETLAENKKAEPELKWDMIKEGEKVSLVLYRRLSPWFLPGSGINPPNLPQKQIKRKFHAPIGKIHGLQNIHGIGRKSGPVIRFFYRNNKILQYNPKDLSIFLALDMSHIFKAESEAREKSIYRSFMLFFVSCGGVLFLFFFQNYKSAKISLGKARKFSDAIIKAMPAGFITTNIKGDILSYNDASELILGMDKKNQFKIPPEIKNLIDFNDIDKLQQKSINKEIGLSGKNFSKHLDINISYIHAGADEKPGILFLIKDETEKNTLKKEIDLNERLASVGKLAAGVAHEIRNPLSSIKGFSTCIKENPSDFQQSIDISSLIINEVDRLDKVVSQLLDFAKPVSLIKENVCIKELIKETIHLLSRDCREKNIDITLSLKNDIKVNSDRDKIKQVILNILSNSIEAISEAGKIKITGHEKDGWLILEFQDSGTGISEDILPHIFDPYYTTKPSGTGIGLAISRNIIKAHNGKIYAKSINRKTTITIKLPLKG